MIKITFKILPLLPVSSHHTRAMAFGDVVEKLGRTENKSIADKVECVLDTCVRKDGVRYYKVAWRDTWEREDLLVACERVIKEFWANLEKEKNVNKKKNFESKQSLPNYKCNITSGRRKSHPKKFIGMENGQNQTFQDFEPFSNEELIVDIPDCRPVEEYPVLIIRDSDVYAEPLAEIQANEDRVGSPQDSSKISCDIELPHKTYRSSDKILEQSEKSLLPNKDVELPGSLKMTILNLNDKSHPTSHVSYNLDSSLSSFNQPHGVCEVRTTYSLRNGSLPNSYVGERITPAKLECDGINKVSFDDSVTKPVQPSHLLLKLSATTPPLVNSPPQVFSVFKASNGEGKRSIALPKNGSSMKPITSLHVVNENGEQRPQCAECFQTFKKRAALERHMMIHRGIKPFQCQFCSQRFRQKHHLQGHVMLHTGERPHSCTLCNKRFRMRHHLLEHERISHKVFR